MNKPVNVSISVGGRNLQIETGRLACQASGSVTVRFGDTILLSAVTCTEEPREGIDYFPLQVEYREKYYAAGRFPGGFFKRESRPSEKETLVSRLTDRPLRPLFPSWYRNDVQVNNQLLSADCENDSDVLSVVAASSALTVSEIPFMGPIAAVRVGRVNGQFVLNPVFADRGKSDIDLIYACTRDLPLMIEGSANEISEADMLAAMQFAHKACVPIIDAQLELRRKLGLTDKKIEEREQNAEMLQVARDTGANAFMEGLKVAGKQERDEKVREAKKAATAALKEKFEGITKEQIRSTLDNLEIEMVRKTVLELGTRVGGRSFDEIRTLDASVGVLPRTHGSALFSRGETQALGTVTLGTKSDTQALDAIAGGEVEKKFMLHYNFPPFSTGEVGKLGSTGRREIGHGALAERSLRPIIPVDYPYTVRIVSEIVGSNGSSSMASICVGCLALMDAGVKIRKPVAGISIGLFTAPGKAQLVTDIIGTEDHCGDMDFKVAGTRDGITGFQVDLKIAGLEWDLVKGAFEKARVARLKILDFMAGVIAGPREQLSPYAPRIHTMKIDQEKIGDLIGPGGKNIRRITELSGAQIDIEEDGTVNIFATSGESMDIAVREVSAVTAEVEEGKLYEGTVTGVKEFGAFVEVLPGQDGLVHISEMADVRIRSVDDVCKIGDKMWVKCIGVDDRGRVKLSRKQAMKELDAKRS